MSGFGPNTQVPYIPVHVIKRSGKRSQQEKTLGIKNALEFALLA